MAIELNRQDAVKILRTVAKSATYHLSKDQMKYAHSYESVLSKSRLTRDLEECEALLMRAIQFHAPKEIEILRKEPVVDMPDEPEPEKRRRFALHDEKKTKEQ